MRKRSRKSKKQETTQLPSKCAWCDKPIAEDAEVFSLGAKAKPEFDLTAVRGTVIELLSGTSHKVLTTIVTTEESEAKTEQGYDFMFMICSKYCGLALREDLAKGMALYNRDRP